jgi:hypothetical protein
MKKLILILAVALLPFVASAQTDTTQTKAREEYCIINVHKGIFDELCVADVDFGQGQEADHRLRDSNRKEIRFNSLVDALNYMARQGWLFVNPLQSNTGESYKYLMRRPVSAGTH